MKQIQQWYPSPPLVVFLSNNEHAKLNWTEADTDQRYLEQHGKGRDDDFKPGWSPTAGSSGTACCRTACARGWRRKRGGRTRSTSGTTPLALPISAAGADGRRIRSTARGGFPRPLMWDGGSPSYYTDDWNQRQRLHRVESSDRVYEPGLHAARSRAVEPAVLVRVLGLGRVPGGLCEVHARRPAEGRPNVQSRALGRLRAVRDVAHTPSRRPRLSRVDRTVGRCDWGKR